MSINPTPLQTLFLWALLFQHHGSALQQDLRPELKTGQRDELIRAGLLEKEKRGRKLHLTLTEAGWAWAEKNLTHEISLQSRASGPVLQAVLDILQKMIGSGEKSLAELFQAAPQAEVEMQPQALDLAARIRQYWQQTTGGRRDLPVRLAQLRQELADVARPALDTVLVEMHRTGGLILTPLESYRDITAADKKAAITIADEANHLFYME